MAESSAGGMIALGLLALAIYACSERAPSTAPAVQSTSLYAGDEETDRTDGDDGTSVVAEREPFDEDKARRDAEDELGGSSYVAEGSPYGCRDDCSGHEAGWRWRAEHGYEGHNADSPSFEEGGRAFDEAVDEKVEEARDAYEREE